MTDVYQRYHAAAARMDALIDMTPTPTDTSIEAVTARADMRMKRLRDFLARVGNPHIGRPMIHIGGTSGKGSTSTIITAILSAAGYRTGLHTSPYLQTPSEKLQVNGRILGPEGYAELVDEFFVAHDAWMADGHPPLTYGESFNALMWMFFRKEDVDIAVVEVGAGGRFDLTNILEPTLSVITSVGIDHTATLGSTVTDIAWHKAGIIKPGVPVVSGVPNPIAQEIIRKEAAEKNAHLFPVDIDEIVEDVKIEPTRTSWREIDTGITHSMRMAGSFQARNGQLAISAMRVLRDYGFSISDEAISTGLMEARIPGRAELIQDSVPVLLDGAHNAEKVAALVEDVPALLPVPEGKRIVVAGLLEAKQGDAMIASLVPVTDVLIATSPQVFAKDAMFTSTIKDYAYSAGYEGDVYSQPDPMRAIEHALELAEPGRDAILVTGSLYLVGNVRERWYPKKQMLATQSCWVETAVGS